MREKIKKYLKEFLVAIVFLTIFANAFSYYRSMDLNKNSLNLEQVKLLDNTEYTLPKNKPIMVHFWATWCPTCKLEAANIEKVSKEYEVITIAVQSGTNEEIESYMKKNELTFKVVNDENGYYSEKFNVKAFPTTFIYDKNKKLKFTEVGYTTTAGLYLKMSLTK